MGFTPPHSPPLRDESYGPITLGSCSAGLSGARSHPIASLCIVALQAFSHNCGHEPSKPVRMTSKDR
jgi:hypothetical protein